MEKTKTIHTENTFNGTARDLLARLANMVELIRITPCKNPDNMRLAAEFMVKAHHELQRILLILNCDSRGEEVQGIRSDHEETTIVGPFKQ